MPAEPEMTESEMLALLEESLPVADRAPSPERIAALRGRAVAAQALATETAGAPASLGAARPRRSPTRRVALAAAAAVVLVGAFVAGGQLANDESDDADEVAAPVEFAATLLTPAGQPAAEVTGVKVGIGRIVNLRTDALPILPRGEFYELWFVGPGDSPSRPNRISAGTFHPDEAGRSDVEMTAAVDPAIYPELSVTAEPGDGNPQPTGPEVLRAAVRPRAVD